MHRREYEGSSGIPYSGKEFEYDLFSQVGTRDEKYLADYRAMQPAENGWLPWHKALELVKKHQPWADPANPSKDFFRELLIAVQEKLSVDTKNDPDAIQAYTAVGTPLDVFHGVDAFIIMTVDGHEEIVTLDATLDSKKIEDGGKADEIVTDLPSVEDDQDGYLEAIDALAERIARRFKDQAPRSSKQAAAE